jgi:lysophospholipase L1-like esterase
MGFGGDRIQHLLWRLQNGELEWISPKVAVLLIGTNNSADNTAEQIAEGIEAVCALIHKKLPQTRILLLAIFPRDTPDAPRRKVNEAVNGMIAGLDDGEWIFFRDLGGFLVDGSGVIKTELMEDLLHPTAAGYREWARVLNPVLLPMLEDAHV